MPPFGGFIFLREYFIFIFEIDLHWSCSKKDVRILAWSNRRSWITFWTYVAQRDHSTSWLRFFSSWSAISIFSWCRTSSKRSFKCSTYRCSTIRVWSAWCSNRWWWREPWSPATDSSDGSKSWSKEDSRGSSVSNSANLSWYALIWSTIVAPAWGSTWRYRSKQDIRESNWCWDWTEDEQCSTSQIKEKKAQCSKFDCSQPSV